MEIFYLAQNHPFITLFALVGAVAALKSLLVFLGVHANVGVAHNVPNQNGMITKCEPVITQTTIKFTPDHPLYEPMMKSIGRGDKISAIKMLREAMQIDLKTAKDIVESIQVGQNSTHTQS